jgi:hypothetical protein
MEQHIFKMSLSNVRIMREKILQVGLKTPEWFNYLSDIELAELRVNNHPKAVLDAIAWTIKFAPEAVLIHVAEFKYTKRFHPFDHYSHEKFYAANLRLEGNAILLAKASKPWHSPQRYWRIVTARYARYVFDEWGYDEWIM